MRFFSTLTFLIGMTATSAYALDAPTGLTAELNPADNIVSLNWSAVPSATGYNIYKDFNYIDTVTTATTQYQDMNPGETYYVAAYDNSVSPTAYSTKSNIAYVTAVNPECISLPSHAALTSALKASVLPTGGPANGGFDLNMWAAVVNRDGVVCAVTHSGNTRSDQWPGSRVIAAQKANTANAFSLPSLSVATANLWAATQPGGSLYGLQHSNPVDTRVAYGTVNNEPGSAAQYGTPSDPLTGNFIGGVNVFGGGLALYDENGTLLGAIGVSGDTSCADHNIAWRARAALQLDYVPGGVGDSERPDNINYVDDVANSALQNDFSHPVCAIAGTDNVSDVSANLPAIPQ